MRVLHVSSDYTIGGASRYILTLLKQPEYSSAVDAAVACPEGGPLWAELKNMGGEVTGFPQRDRSLDPALVLRLVGFIKRNRFDIVHTHASLSARLAARLSGGPRIVVTRHTLLPGRATATEGLLRHVSWAARYSIAGTAQALLADRFIAVSHAVRRSMLDDGIPESMIETIHTGVEVEALKREAEQLDGRSAVAAMAGPAWEPGAPVVGTVGRLSREKGHETLVRAAPHILSVVPNAVIVIVGQGEERARLEALARDLGVVGRVCFAGYQENAAAWLNAFDLFVMPSLGEALGIALLEAMALGKPIVASDTGGIPEVVRAGVNGVLVAPGDPLHLAAAVTGLLGDPESSSRMAAAGRRIVQESFTAAAMAKKVAAVYERVRGADDRGAAKPRAPQGR